MTLKHLGKNTLKHAAQKWMAELKNQYFELKAVWNFTEN